MKQFKFIFTAIIAIMFFNSCQDNDNLEFVAAPKGDFAFTNTFLADYILPFETTTDDNIGIVFSFNKADFDVPTNVSYELQTSVTGDFKDAALVNAISNNSNNNNNIEVTIGELKRLATEVYSLAAPTNGTLNFRVRAFPGDTSSTTEAFTPTQQVNVTLLEEVQTGGSNVQVSTWGIVGSGYNDWGNGGPDAPFYTTADANVFVAYVTLLDGEIKIRENNDWANNFGDDGADGTLDAGGANIVSTAGTYKVTLNFNDNTYTIEAYSWGIVGSGFNDWGNAGPDAAFHYDYTTDTFKVGVKLLDGEIKIRLNNDWGTNFGDTGADGTLEAGGDNIATTAGFYTVTFDVNKSTYTIEASDVWGIVGSGYNDWGNAGPDFNFTEVNPGIFVANNVTLLDGEIKFRLNEDWTTNFGDTGADGTLEAGGDNIVTTAGKYRITMDLTDNANPKYTITAL